MVRTPRLADHSTDCSKPSPAPVPGQRRGWGLAIRLGLSMVLLGVLMSGGRFQEVMRHLASIRWLPFLGASLLYAAAQVLSSWRWQWLARPLGLQVGLGRLVQLYFVGMFFNLFLPTSMGGDVVRSWYLSRLQRGATFAAALTSVVSERLNGLVALLVLGCLACPVVLDTLPVWQGALLWGMTAGGIGVLALLPLLARWSRRCQQLAEALSLSARHSSTWAKAFVLSLVIQAAAIVQVGWVAIALDLAVSWRYLVIAVPITTVVSLLPISIAGLGLREGSLALLLAPAGLTAGQCVSLGLGWLTMQGLASLLGAPLWWCLPAPAHDPASTAPLLPSATNNHIASMPDARTPDNSLDDYRHSAQDPSDNGGEAKHGRLSCNPDQGRARQSGAAA